MDKKLATIQVFFDAPEDRFQIREIARLTRATHMTTKSYLKELLKKGVIVKKESKLYPYYVANTKSQKFRTLKRHNNLERLQDSGVVEFLEREQDYPPIVVFGSYANGTDNAKSDIDLFILSDIKKEIDITKYEKKLKRMISLHRFDRQGFNTMKQKNKELLNNICNGVTLSGKLEVV